VKYCFQPLFSYALKDYLSLESSGRDINDFFDCLRTTEDPFICQTQQRSAGALPNFSKQNQLTHICYKEVRYHHLVQHIGKIDKNIKFIFLVRNPVEVMNSWISAPREFDQHWNVDAELLLAEKKKLWTARGVLRFEAVG
jgi:hypothetical protein